MPEILTESFCERCGTRYTFESATPRKTRRIGKFRTLSKGLKNYVLSDDTSMDEAMAAARSDEEREVTTQQLDAFHATFNFCMNCRQYTCSNCWNAVEGRCLSCSPHLGHEILPTPFPDETPFQPVSMITADAWPTADLPGLEAPALAHAGNGSGGVAAVDGEATDSTNGVGHDVEPIEAFDPIARLAFLSGETPVETGAAGGQPPESMPAPAAGPDPVVAESPAVPPPAPAEALSPAADAELLPEAIEDRASILATRTSRLLGRFRPGQNIDAELAAFEAQLEASEVAADMPFDAPVADGTAAELVEAATVMSPEAVPVESVESVAPEPDAAADAVPGRDLAAATPSPEADAATTSTVDPVAPEPAALEQVAIEPVAEPEPLAAVAEPEPLAAAAEPEPLAAAAEPEPLAAAAEPEPQQTAPAPEPERHDQIEQPTWRIFAPDQTPPVADQPGAPPPMPPAAPAPSPVLPPAAGAEPQWPARTEWQDSPSMALLANRNRSSSDALWAASAQEVLAPPAGPTVGATGGVQPCSSCGLSLSATARFCRRCGTRQA